MIKTYLLALLWFIPLSHAGTWQRIDDKRIKFNGAIENGDLEALEALLRPRDNVLYLDSRGGDAQVGVRLAMRLLENKMTVIVDGVCASSCANYLFTAGEKKVIRKGWVGFHGNITAYLAQAWKKDVKTFKANKLTDEKIKEFHRALKDSSKLEAIYFKKIGVKQSLFDRSQKDDKGMNNNIQYAFLVPSHETFKRYGIKNVFGNQDTQGGKELGLNNLYE